jgi:methylated-DNA-[protein]-cysteine S-methyltransferase
MLDLDGAVALDHPGPLGPLWLAATERGLAGVAMLSDGASFADQLARQSGLRLAPAGMLASAARHLDEARRELDEYFTGTLRVFMVPLDLRVRSAWDRLVLAGVRAVPFGGSVGYGELARRIGRPGAARAVGGAVGRNPIAIVIPCHRVIAGDGSLGGYGGDWSGSRDIRLGIKRRLLDLEGREGNPVMAAS